MKSKRRIALLLSVVVMLFAFAFAGCGEDMRSMDFNGYTYEDLQGACQNTQLALDQITPADAAAYTEGASDQTAALVNNWLEIKPELGDFVGFGDFKVTKSGKTLTAEQITQYTNRPVILTYVFNAKNMEVTDITVDMVYTTGEKMSKAGLNTVLCICVVFAVLIIISLVIAAFNLIPKIQKAFEKQPDQAAEEKQDFVEQIAERENLTDDNELIAVIAAAIAASTGTSTDGFVVRSIRRR